MNLLKSISAYLGVARSFHWVTGENQIMRHELEPQKIYIRDVDFPVLENRFESWCNLLCKSLEWRSLKCVNRNLKIKWITIIDTVGDFWVTTEIHLVTVVLWLYMCASWCYFRSLPRSDIIPTSRISLVSQILSAPKWQGNEVKRD